MARSPTARDELDAEASRALKRLEHRHLHRTMRLVEGRAGPRMRVDGRDVVMLAGSNYLDLAADPRVIEAGQAAIEQWGAAAGGSRLISGNLAVHEELEGALARFMGTEAALVFNSGYMANLGVLGALAGRGDVIVSDALNHASIVDACRLSRAETRVFRHNDPEDLHRVASGLAGFRRRLLVVDGVYSMDGDVARLDALVPIAREHDMTVIVDDAHGAGVLGDEGRGALELTGQSADVVVGNLAKAIGAFGAYVCCSNVVRELLINTARSFIFTCALPPACVSAALAGLRIVAEEPWRRTALLERAGQLRTALRDAGFDTGPSTTHIVPAIVGENRMAMTLCQRALERGVYAQGIRFPAVPRGTARIRFTPMSSHTADDVSRAVAVFAELRMALESPSTRVS